MRLSTILSPFLFAGIVVSAAVQNLPRGLAVSAEEFSSQVYHHIVIGGGTTGLAVAARLSEDPNVLVGVIEAGSYFENDPAIDTPALAAGLPGDAKYDWMFQSVPQDNLKGRRINLPRGKLLGGSSGIGRMVFARASRLEYDAWASLGNSKWCFDELLPYMKAAEHFTGADPFRVNETGADPSNVFPSQGTNGPVAASYNTWYSDLVTSYRKTMTNAGVPINYDPDSGNTSGIFNSPVGVNRTTGKRAYAALGYYKPNAHRPNLVVLTGAQVLKIDFQNARTSGGLTATGVLFTRSGATFRVKTSKAVILAAGALKTPQLLELSGIGNPTILSQFGIEPLIKLPGVGENYQDHVYVSTTYELKPGSSSQNFDRLRDDPTFQAAAKAQYESTHDGILSDANSMIGFIGLEYLANSTKIASMIAQLDREAQLQPQLKIQSRQYAIQKDFIRTKVGHVEVILYPGYEASMGTPKVNTSYISIQLALEHPFSRGDVHTQSSDPLVPPQINPRYLSKSIDQDALVQAVKFSLKISQTEPLASLIATRQDPAPNIVSDAEILDYIKETASTIHHPIGTAMMAPHDYNGVVDQSLMVYGTTNLFVVDSSVIPLHIGTHLVRTQYGFGERAAAIIKKRFN